MIIYKQEEAVIYSMDGLFGLPRKKSAGRSHRPALHSHLFFEDQEGVDQFVSEAQRRLSKNDANVGVCISNTTSCIASIFHRSAVIFWQGTTCAVLFVISLWMRLLCLGMHVDMSFLDDFST